MSLPPRQNSLVAEQSFSALSEQATPASESTDVHEDVPLAAVEEAIESGWKASATIASEITQEHQPVTTEPTTIRSGRRLSVVMGLLSIALICLGIFFKGQSTTGSAGPQLLAAATASADVQNSPWLPTDAISSPKYQTVPIRDIQAAGYRVLAENPETPGQAPSDYGEFDRETWRVLQLQISKPDGGWLKVSLARPLSWIDEAPKNSDGSIWLEFEELGIANWAEVLSINECPEGILGDGRLVTGTFQHSAANVIELTFSHSEEAIRSTSNHPFWSEDRQEFVQAGELTPGEHVRLLDGSTSSLARAVPLEEEFPVFNLEVDGEHVYYVGLDGMLVHNAGRGYGPKRFKDKNPQYKDSYEIHHSREWNVLTRYPKTFTPHQLNLESMMRPILRSIWVCRGFARLLR
ncbi:MAG: polymorphic toxin-type HINT domain-containing protein [Fuerstiella sp.]